MDRVDAPLRREATSREPGAALREGVGWVWGVEVGAGGGGVLGKVLDTFV